MKYGMFDPKIVVNECLDLLSIEAEKKNVQLLSDIGDNITEYIYFMIKFFG
jgi:hypothetical protein